MKLNIRLTRLTKTAYTAIFLHSHVASIFLGKIFFKRLRFIAKTFS